MLNRSLDRLHSQMTLGVPPSVGLREALQWSYLVRLTILSILLVQLVFRPMSSLEPWVTESIISRYGLLAIIFLWNLLSSLSLYKFNPTWGHVTLQLALDALIPATWIGLTAGRENIIVLLYGVQIITASLIFFRKGATLSSLFAVVFYGLVVWLTIDIFPDRLFTWAAYAVFFVALGFSGGYLSEELLRSTQKLKEKSAKIESLMLLHERIISDLPTGLLTVDDQMRVNFINPAGAHILNRAESTLVGQNLADIEPGLMPFFLTIEAEAVIEESTQQEELAVTGSDGGHRSYFMSTALEHGRARLQQRVELGSGSNRKVVRGDVAPLEAEGGLGRLLEKQATGGRVLLFQDVTKIIHLEERLQQHEKLAAVGQLAAGIAHEIRNPLASMSASIEMLRDVIPASAEQGENRRLMDIAIREIDRLNRLVSEFLDFVRPEKFKKEPVELEAILSDLSLSLQAHPQVKDRIQVEENFAAGVMIEGNAEKLKQVLWNLGVNAAQAISGSGRIEIGSVQKTVTRVMVWVEDSGKGMSEDELSHLYEPFYTTKARGTGLGLATVYKIVEAHHGEITVRSKVNEGTRFEITLPSV